MNEDDLITVGSTTKESSIENEVDTIIELSVINANESDNTNRNINDNNNIIDKADKFFGKLEYTFFKTPERVPEKSTLYKILHLPLFTFAVTIVDIALMIWLLSKGVDSTGANPFLGPTVQTLIDCGAKYTPAIVEGEWWRLITAMFLHAGIIHLVTNLMVQIIFGIVLERRFGTIRFATIYLISGIGGNLMSAIFVPRNLVTVGASGALFGIIMMWIVDVAQHYKQIQRPLLTLLIPVIAVVVSIGLGLLPYMDNFAHIGGIIFGTELSIMLIPKFVPEPPEFTTSKLKNRIRLGVSIAMIPLFLLNFIGFFVILYVVNMDIREWCYWCTYINCIPNSSGPDNWCNT